MAEEKLTAHGDYGTACISPLVTLPKPITSGAKADSRFDKQDFAI